MALRAGFTVIVMLSALAATGHIPWAMYAIFGGFTNIHGPGRARPGRWRMQGLAAISQTLAVAIGSLVALSPQRDWVAVAVIPLVVVAAHWHYDRFGIVPHAPLFAVLAAAASAARPMVVDELLPAVLVTATAGAFAVGLGQLAHVLHPQPDAEPVSHGPFQVTRVLVQDAVLAAVTVALAGALANLTGIGHSFWAMLSATIAMSMPHRRARIVRAVNRIIGTTAGVLVAGGLLSLELAAWQKVTLAGVLQGLATMLVPRQYALAMLVITPLALMVIQWAAPQPVAPLLVGRLLETVIGALVALAVASVDRRTAG